MILTQRNWLIGYRIAEEELASEQRAEYGAEVIKRLSRELTTKYGKGFTKTNLYSFYRFYKCFPEIFHTACGKSNMCLSWSHYRTLLQVHDETARNGMRKKLMSRHGVFVPYREILIPSIIIVCFNHRIRML